MTNASNYLKELKKRAGASRVYKKYQLDGLEIADLLNDRTHKALYIRLAKERGDASELRHIAGTIAENSRIKNKGAYFMTVITGKSNGSNNPHHKS